MSPITPVAPLTDITAGYGFAVPLDGTVIGFELQNCCAAIGILPRGFWNCPVEADWAAMNGKTTAAVNRPRHIRASAVLAARVLAASFDRKVLLYVVKLFMPFIMFSDWFFR
jgi:hypothetical protein